jgi:hypothetical protein
LTLFSHAGPTEIALKFPTNESKQKLRPRAFPTNLTKRLSTHFREARWMLWCLNVRPPTISNDGLGFETQYSVLVACKFVGKENDPIVDLVRPSLS